MKTFIIIIPFFLVSIMALTTLIIQVRNQCSDEVRQVGGLDRFHAQFNQYCIAIMPDGSLKVIRKYRF